jgi:tRNA (guanine37-N1)-methyltransferase
MKFHVVTLFPEVIDAYAGASILSRANKAGLLEVKSYQLRDFVTNKWGKADERPYGGGPGMVLQAEPFLLAVEAISKKINKTGSKKKTSGTMIYHSASKKPKVLITSAGGKPLTNAYAKKLSKEKDVIILCGRYEGIDARVKKVLKAEEVSVGPYILTGGELPALTIIDTTARQIKGVLGKFESLEESRVASHEIYTRPEVLEFKGKKYRVPKVLLSGHHANIDALRSKKRSKPQ